MFLLAKKVVISGQLTLKKTQNQLSKMIVRNNNPPPLYPWFKLSRYCGIMYVTLIGKIKIHANITCFFFHIIASQENEMRLSMKN